MLLSYCERKFITRRFAVSRNHLEELDDHRVIIYDGVYIEYLMGSETCKAFVEYTETVFYGHCAIF